MANSIHLSAPGYDLNLEPGEGGAVARFDWKGHALFRPRCGVGPLNSSCFPLTPFSNRIAHGRFEVEGRLVKLAPNFPGSDHPHTLHGFGWQRPWKTIASDGTSATLSWVHDADAWPWAFEAEQRFTLSADGLRHDISVRNLAETPMPAGLGVHPYFPTTPLATYMGLHRGEWVTSADGLPIELKQMDRPTDWWRSRPVASRAVDTVYTQREGPIAITWPERDVRLLIKPSDELSFTVVYSPPGEDFFCVEPVSHETDAINRGGSASGLRWLAPGETFSAHVAYAAQRLDVSNAETTKH